MTTAAETAEWICTRCGATNRKLVPVRTTRTIDRCVTCHAEHVVEPNTRPVRWDARLKGKKGRFLPFTFKR
jgi:DNA-directed RNA polymerase subunit RPC12/RpoP